MQRFSIMPRGLRTKSERFIQMLRQTDPSTFDPNAARIICSNLEDYSYNPTNTYDSVKRRGANAKSFNALTEAMRTGDMSGALYYNLVEDQILPYVFAEATSDATAAGVRTRIYDWAQSGRNDRPFFAIEEGVATRCVRGLAGHFNSFKFTSKRGQNGQSRFSAGFTTTNAPEVGAMTGGAAQNSVLNITATNVTTEGVFSIKPGALAAQNVSFAVGDTTAQMVAKLAAIGITATVAGTVAVSTGETHTLSSNGAIGNATIYNTVVVTPGMTALALRDAIRALGGNYANVTVNGSTTAGATNLVGTGTASASSSSGGAVAAFAFDNDPATAWQAGSTAVPQSLQYQFTSPQLIAAYAIRSTTGNLGAETSTWQFQGSTDGTAWSTLDTQTGVANQVGGGRIVYNIASPGNYAYYRLLISSSRDSNISILQVYGLELLSGPATGTYTIAFPAGVGNVADITGAPGAGWTSGVTQAGNASGSMVITVTAPAQTSVTISPVSGAGWSGAVPQSGSNGQLRSVLKAALPVLPQHLSFYVADSYAGLDAPSAYVGTIEEFEFDIPKVREPRMPHNGQVTYSEVVDSEDVEIKLMVLLFADQGSSTRCQDLVANGEAYISKPMYWRVQCAQPGTSHKIIFEFYGSVGETVEVEYNGNVEERRFHFDLIENLELDWNCRVLTKVPV